MMSELERLDAAIEGAWKCWNNRRPVDAITVSKLIDAARAYRDLLANGQRVEWCEEHLSVRSEGNINCWAAQTLWRSDDCRIVSKLLSLYPKEAENDPD